MAASVTLQQLGLTAAEGRNPAITGIAVDSREVQAGFLFAALPGSKVHGGEFIQYALRMDVGAILTDAVGAEIAADGLPIPMLPSLSPTIRAALWPLRRHFILVRNHRLMTAVTGTNGKTSVSTFVRQIWNLLDLEAVNLGTTGVEGSLYLPLAHTTPEPITLHRTPCDLGTRRDFACGDGSLVHGLDQRRLDGVNLLLLALPTSRRTTLIITARLRRISTRKSGCLRGSCKMMAWLSSTLTIPKGQRWR